MKNSLRLQVLAFVVTRIVLGTMLRMVYPFLTVFGRGLGVDLWQLSMAVTIRQSAGVLGPFLGSVADSRGRKTGVLFGLFLCCLGAALIAFWPTFPAFVLALVLTLLGNMVFIPAIQAYIGDRVPYQRRGQVLAITEFGWSLSFIIGMPIIGLLIERGGWRLPFPVLAGLAGVAILLLSVLLPKDAKRDHNAPNLLKNLRQVLTFPPALAGMAMGAMTSGSNEVVNLVFGAWIENSFGLKVAALGAAAMVIGFSELGGEALVSTLTDRLGKERSVKWGLVANSLAALLLPFIGRSLVGALIGLALLFITFEFTLVSSIPLMSEVVPGARATLMATFIACGSLGRALGDLLATPLYSFGISANLLVAVLFNLGALAALALLKKKTAETLLKGEQI